MLALAVVALVAPRAHAQDVTDDGRVAVVFAHPLFLDKFSGIPYVWFDDQTGSVTSYRIAFPNVIYHAKPWLQGWSGVILDWKNDPATTTPSPGYGGSARVRASSFR